MNTTLSQLSPTVRRFAYDSVFSLCTISRLVGEAYKKLVLQMFKYSYFLTRMFPLGNFAVYMSARTLAETEDNLIKARKIDGVRDARILIFKEMRENT